jgi:uncharacterized protein YjeT (DUF2065 family)
MKWRRLKDIEEAPEVTLRRFGRCVSPTLF